MDSVFDRATARPRVAMIRTDVDAEFAAFFRAEFPHVVRTVHAIVRDRPRAEDIAQDAFVQAVRHWPKVAGYDRPGAWVRRVAIRLAMRDVRRQRLWSVIRRDVRTPPSLQPRDLDVFDAIGHLPGMQRAAIALFYLEDRPTAEIADLLGCSEPTARVHLHRGRKRLAVILGEGGDHVA